MVFGIDDIAEDSIIGGLLVGLSSWLFSGGAEAAEVAATTLPEIGSSIATSSYESSNVVVVQDLLGEDGLEAIHDLNEVTTSDHYNNYAKLVKDLLGEDGLEAIHDLNEGVTTTGHYPMYTELYNNQVTDLSSLYDELLEQGNKMPNKDSFIDHISKLSSSIGKKIPVGTEGFKRLIKDIATYAVKNPKKIAGGTLATAGAIGVSMGVYNEIKKAYKSGKRLPKDSLKTVKDTVKGKLNKISKDIKQEIEDISPFKIDEE